jgi:Skp family chaperone for outer membrane proteins
MYSKFEEGERMKFHHVVLLLAGLLLGAAAVNTGAHAQGGANAPAPAKIGVISLRDAVAATADGKQKVAELQSQFAPKSAELDALRKQIDDLQNRLTALQRTGSDEEKAKISRQGQVLTSRLTRENDNFNEEIQAAQADVFDAIGRRMLDILDRYSRENGFVIIFDKSAQTSPVVTSSPSIDVTQEIVKLYDQQFPVRGAASAPAKQPAPTPPPKKPGSNQ